MAEKYYSILTNRGKELEAQSSATGKPVIIKDFVVGDGNGQAVTPDPARTSLVKEVYRGAISALQISPDQTNQFIAQLALGTDVGGFVVREVGLLTDAGELYSVANCAAIEKPENSVSVSLQYRLAVSETANIELKTATGDGLFLRQDANLSDLKDASESRKNIGLKGAAVLDVGDTADTVAAGDDTRIVNALQKQNNLSELTDKEEARKSLELKSAAQKEVVTSLTDETAGRVPVVGWQGLGGTGQQAKNADLLSTAGVGSRIFVQGGGSDTNHFGSYGSGLHMLYGPSGDGLKRLSANMFIDYAGNLTVEWLEINISTGAIVSQRIQKVYGPLNKPTAGEVGALPIGGGTMEGQISLPGVGAGSWANQNTNGAPLYQNINTASSSQYWPIFKQHYTQGNSTWSGGMLINEGDFHLHYLAGTGGTTNFRWTKDGQFIPPNYANFDAKYQVKGSYTPAGQAYTKAESDGRYQKINTASKAANGWYKDANTGMIFQWGRVGTSTPTNVSVTFPIAFPSACVSVQNTIIRPTNDAGENNWTFVTSISKTGASIGTDRNGAFWFAVGY